jgi:hypothetical protein
MRNQQFHSSPLPLPQHLGLPGVLQDVVEQEEEKVPVNVLPTRLPTAALPSTPKAATATAALPSPEPAAEDAAAQPSIQEEGHVVAP